ncbi:MAG TPA: AAA family ATPase, partial [Burkholderiales bacterium]|nr:AAA family ATPase [Burkholderiales bacterium]
AMLYFKSTDIEPSTAPENGPCDEWSGYTDDDDLIRAACASRSISGAFSGRASFNDLWTGNADALARAFPATERIDGLSYDASSADAALASHLAFWTGKDAVRMERLMRQSALVRPKWDRPDYLRNRTIPHAISNCREVHRRGKTEQSSTPLQGISAAYHASGITGIEVKCASEIEPEAIKWIWHGWLASGKFHILGGAPGTGKTTLAIKMAAIVSNGSKWPDGTFSKTGKVLIWSGEDDPADTLVPRLIASGANRSQVFFVCDSFDERGHRAFDPASDMALLAAKLNEIGGVSLIIVDPIVSAVAADSHKNG